jgi:hypothetical protein
MGVRLKVGELEAHAPYGLGDLFKRVVRPVKEQLLGKYMKASAQNGQASG